ncbi:MAG TPA: amidohydrolase family protein, partial [Rubrivivax sp.]|nr:amidohydrolase family protein [Rubrivivax sp.]
MAAIDGHILTPRGFVQGRIEFGARIVAVRGRPIDASQARDGAAPIVLPGFVDLHVHGGGGHDTMAGGDAVPGLARAHARHGTTALLATTMTAPRAEIESALAALAPGVASRPVRAARVLGVHLEGPYINRAKLGA